MMDVLALLAMHCGEVLSKEQIIREVWPDTFISDEVLYRCISGLRKALRDDGRNPRIVRTIPKRGYCLMCRVTGPNECPCARLRKAGKLVPGKIIGSVAVLPFLDITPEKNLDCFCEGLAEEITNALAGVQGLRVAARTSASQFNDRTEDVKGIAQRLSVCAVLRGSVRRASGLMRITAQLICAMDGCQIWSERYDCAENDPFSVQDMISRSVADKLRVCTQPSRAPRFTRQG
jgi:TolB-like protein